LDALGFRLKVILKEDEWAIGNETDRPSALICVNLPLSAVKKSKSRSTNLTF